MRIQPCPQERHHRRGGASNLHHRPILHVVASNLSRRLLGPFGEELALIKACSREGAQGKGKAVSRISDLEETLNQLLTNGLTQGTVQLYGIDHEWELPDD